MEAVMINAGIDDVSALVPAAGLGERLGLGPKAFLMLNGRPLLAWVADKVSRVAREVILALPEKHLEEARSLCPNCICISGAATRQDTIAELVRVSSRNILLIQDLARPFASERLLRDVCLTAKAHGIAGAFYSPGVPVARVSEDGWVRESYLAKDCAIFQSPQAFRRDLLQSVLASTAEYHWRSQSTIELAIRAGIPVRVVPGEVQNLKITTPEDWRLGQSLAGYLE
jgi:2-C-methyl-D-erythritol 4-phosphate cytidylyltransferase